ncbi:molybdate ABC transporter substrate-binding protein [Novosphingobium sp. Chol11]|uniref:molybdate ABC transporter substrate-binding protein n=1 Tax=Novosphingobium sp. Chol11 TaxID=1385763 RepID=UPI0025D9F090|nr:molybdate ABC transporter substrate-binding protein [Novosphingobium sp. Chol11]
MIRSVLKSALLLLLLAAGPPVMAQPPKGPLVLAASSLQEAMSAAADAWAAPKGRARHPRPVVSFAASSALARQVEARAPADLFVSADEEWMTYVEKKGLIAPRTRVPFLSNQLVLVAPAAARRGSLPVRPGFGLMRALAGGRLAVADPDAVPAGRYAKQALTRLGVWSQVEGSLARAENVRAALALVARGAAPLGVVYLTDARAEPAVRVVGVFPAGSHTAITYPLARLATSASPDAEGFRRFLLSAEGKAIFRRFGFIPR